MVFNKLLVNFSYFHRIKLFPIIEKIIQGGDYIWPIFYFPNSISPFLLSHLYEYQNFHYIKFHIHFKIGVLINVKYMNLKIISHFANQKVDLEFDRLKIQWTYFGRFDQHNKCSHYPTIAFLDKMRKPNPTKLQKKKKTKKTKTKKLVREEKKIYLESV